MLETILWIIGGLVILGAGYFVFVWFYATNQMNKDPFFQAIQNYHNASRNELARHLNQEAMRMNSSSN